MRHAARRAAGALLAALLLLLCALPAAAVPHDPTGRGVGFSVVLYDNTNGLPTSAANAVVQTEEGFVWIGSYSGLIRYDGNEFYRYDSSTGVSSVVSLFADSRNRLWIGTNDSGVFVLEHEKFRAYDRAEGLGSSSVRSILEDEHGNILVATTMGLSYVDPEGVMHAIDEPQLNREYICELVDDADGVIYGVTLSGAFFTLKDLRLTAFYDSASMGYGVINTVYPDPRSPGWLYLGTQNATIVHGELAKGMAESRVIPVKPQENVRCIRLIDDLLWVCADTGIGFLNDSGYVPLADLPMNNSVEHMMRDFEDNLWFTSSRQGLMKIVRNRFTDVSELAELPPMVVNTTLLQDGLLYIGADNGLCILDADYRTVENELTALLEGVRIRSIHADRAGDLWFGTNSAYGLLRYRPSDGSWQSFNTETGLASNRARTVRELSDGRLAVATNAGVNLLENGEVVGLYAADQGISNLEILCLEEGPNGEIYAGSDGDGIYIIEGDRVSHLGRDDGLRSEVILRLRRDPVDSGLYWIVTSNSLAWLRDGAVTTVQHFPYSNNFDLYFDALGRVWVLSSNGIYVVRRDSLLTDEKIDYTLYDTSSGLPCAATANSYSFLAEDGTLYLAASTGVSAVNINDGSEGDGTVRLSVPFLQADDVYLEVTDGQATIPADCKRLRICAYAFSYSLNNPHLRYALEGFDDAPTELTQHELRPLSYTNLPGGTYRFRLAVLNTMTGQESQVLTLTLTKEKTVYEQSWFWVLLGLVCILAVAGALMAHYRRKTRALLKQQAEHRQLIDEMTSVFASCIDLKDPYTNGHSHRVAKYAAMLAERLGKTPAETEEIYRIALLHDIGKIAIPDSILNKPDRLTDEEFAVMKSHPLRGYEILKDISIAPELAIGAGYHHERLDGKGYPQGLKREDIPEVAQIIAVADTFDAMYSTRPYRKRLPLSTITAELQRNAGTQLNETAVAALLALIEEGAIREEPA